MEPNNEHTRIVEINGIKMEIDMRTAKVHTVENYKVGDFLKVLSKTYSGHEVKTGVIVGFYGFKKKPTIIIATIDNSWGSSSLAFIHYTDGTEEIEIVPMDAEDLSVDVSKFITAFDREIDKKNMEIREIMAKRDFFMAHFGKTHVAAMPAEEPVSE